MKTSTRQRNLFMIGLAAAALFACGCTLPTRPPEEIRTFLLSVSPPKALSSVQTSNCFSVRPCRAESAFAAKTLIYRTGESEYESDFYNQLLTTPAENVTQTLSNWITAAGWTLCPQATAAKDSYTLAPVLSELYGDFRDPANPYAMVKIRISLTITDPKCNCVNTLVNKTYQARILLNNATIRELIRAYSKGLEKIFADFQKDAEAEIR